MLTMDAFNGDAFKATSMTAAINKVDYAPQYLGELGVFEPVSVRTHDVFIEERGTKPALILTSEPGTPPKASGGDRRTARSFRTVRIADSSRIMASEVQGIRAFGSETELSNLEIEVVARQAKLKGNAQLTFEHYRLGVVTKAKLLDADGSTLYDWAEEFGQAIPVPINFDLTNANPAAGALRKKCSGVRRAMLKNLKNGSSRVTIHAIVGDDFYDDLVNHPEVEKTYLATAAASDLRDGHGTAYESFRYGGITWHNYRGSDDGAVGIDAGEAHFFPVGAGIFQRANAPVETFEFANTPGQEFYSWIVRDKDRDMWADVEIYARPLFVCTQPSALRKATRTA